MPVSVELYWFWELSEEARKTAIDWWRQQLMKQGGHECIYSDLDTYFTGRLDELGLPVEDIRWSLGYCQGDGMRFTGSIDLEKYMRAHELTAWGPMWELVNVWIEPVGHHYVHFNTMAVEYTDASDEEDCEHPAAFWIHSHVNELIEHVKNRIVELSKELEQKGYEIIESYDTDEFLGDELSCDTGRLFYKDGEYACWEDEVTHESA